MVLKYQSCILKKRNYTIKYFQLNLQVYSHFYNWQPSFNHKLLLMEIYLLKGEKTFALWFTWILRKTIINLRYYSLELY